VKVVIETPKPPDPPKADPKSTPGSLSLSSKLSNPYLVPGSSDVFLTADVTAVEVPGAKRSPVNMALVIDRSGSMSGDKIIHARQAALALLEKLDEHDRLTIVHFGSDVTVMPGAMVTEDNRRRFKAFIHSIVDEGGTNIGGGLAAAKYQLDKGRSDFQVNRMVLVSDGQPTVGITSAAALTRIAQTYHSNGVTLTSIGVGLDFNEDLMTRLAALGGGSYAYLKETSQLANIFEQDLKQAGTLVARDVKLKFTLPAGVRFDEVLGRESSVSGNVVTVTMPDFSAGQVERMVMRVTAQANAGDNQSIEVAAVRMDYQDLLANHPADADQRLSALVTNDAHLAQTKRDKDVAVAAVRAQAAVNYRKAAQAISDNNPYEAQRALKGNEVLFDDLSTMGAGDAVKEEREQNANYYQYAQPSAPAAARMDGTKAMKKQSLKSSGWGLSAY
jgi:Ca-activated chloride channel family protein